MSQFSGPDHKMSVGYEVDLPGLKQKLDQADRLINDRSKALNQSIVQSQRQLALETERAVLSPLRTRVSFPFRLETQAAVAARASRSMAAIAMQGAAIPYALEGAAAFAPATRTMTSLDHLAVAAASSRGMPMTDAFLAHHGAGSARFWNRPIKPGALLGRGSAVGFGALAAGGVFRALAEGGNPIEAIPFIGGLYGGLRDDATGAVDASILAMIDGEQSWYHKIATGNPLFAGTIRDRAQGIIGDRQASFGSGMQDFASQRQRLSAVERGDEAVIRRIDRVQALIEVEAAIAKQYEGRVSPQQLATLKSQAVQVGLEGFRVEDVLRARETSLRVLGIRQQEILNFGAGSGSSVTALQSRAASAAIGAFRDVSAMGLDPSEFKRTLNAQLQAIAIEYNGAMIALQTQMRTNLAGGVLMTTAGRQREEELRAALAGDTTRADHFRRMQQAAEIVHSASQIAGEADRRAFLEQGIIKLGLEERLRMTGRPSLSRRTIGVVGMEMSVVEPFNDRVDTGALEESMNVVRDFAERFLEKFREPPPSEMQLKEGFTKVSSLLEGIKSNTKGLTGLQGFN